jgi:hypothetical protein
VYTTPTPGAERAFGGTVKGEQGAQGSPISLPGANDIPVEVCPWEADLVLAKPRASAFFATPQPVRNGCQVRRCADPG